FVVLGLAGQAFIYRTPDREAPDPASDLVLAAAVDGDLVAFDSFGAAAPFRHRVAVTGAAGPGGAVPAEAGPAPAEDNPLEPVVLRPLDEAAPEVPADGSVWVIRNRSDQLSRSAVAEPLSDAGFAPVAAWELGAVDLERWQRR